MGRMFPNDPGRLPWRRWLLKRQKRPKIHKFTIPSFAVMLVLSSYVPAFGGNNADLKSAADHEVERKHHLAVFLGDTHTEDDEDAFTMGLDYEYRVAPVFGIGALGEYAGGNIESGVIGAPLSLHPYGGVRLVAMPGVEITEEHTNFLFRLGIGYEFELERWTIAPEFNADFVESDTNLVFGVSVGLGF
jgi:hypothetical protein